MAIRVIAGAVALWLSCTTASAQMAITNADAAGSLPQALSAVRLAAEAATPRAEHVGAEAQLSEINEALTRIEGEAYSMPAAQKRAYAVSLNSQAALLTAAATSPGQSQSAALFADAGTDLRLKADSFGFSAPTALKGLIKVTARTLQNAAEVKGLVVGASPVAYANAPDPLYRFPKVSSPTTATLPPGRYEFLVKASNRVVAREKLDVGLNNVDAVEVDLVIPADEKLQ